MKQLTAMIWPEHDMYVALCPELDIVSQGEDIEQARAMLQEAVEGVLEVADNAEIERRLARGPVAVTIALEVQLPAEIAA